jgi:hypothetical protein
MVCNDLVEWGLVVLSIQASIIWTSYQQWSFRDSGAHIGLTLTFGCKSSAKRNNSQTVGPLHSKVFPATISFLRKRLPPRQTAPIQIRLLADPHSTVASPDTQARIVEDGRMVDSTIVPNGCYKQRNHPVSIGVLARKEQGMIKTHQHRTHSPTGGEAERRAPRRSSAGTNPAAGGSRQASRR